VTAKTGLQLLSPANANGPHQDRIRAKDSADEFTGVRGAQLYSKGPSYWKEDNMEMDTVLALQETANVSDPLDDEMCWSTCSSSGCHSSSVFVGNVDEKC